MLNVETKALKKACLITFGCQMNDYDSGRLAQALKNDGWEIVEDKSAADFIFFNTCSIREKAFQKIVNHLKEVRHLKIRKPELVIGVGGCVAEQLGEEIFEKTPWVSLVVGPQHLPEIPGCLKKLEVSSAPILLVGGGQRPAWSSENLQEQGYPALIPPVKSRSAFVTIMQGCNNYCAYCVVPYVRGREMSRTPEDITHEVRGLLSQGVYEVTLLGQNVNSYGQGLAGGFDFPDLLSSLSTLPGLRRLRFTTSHPKDFPDKLVNLYGQLPTLCEQLHLPVQSGSDAVLKAMGRKYTITAYRELLGKLRQRVSDLALSTDIIVGFPGETEADFEETMKLISDIGYDSMFSFKYSDRPQTKAMGMENKVAEDVKSRRLSELQKVQKKIMLEKNQAHVGQIFELLVESTGRKEGQLSGRGRNMKIVNFFGPESLIGHFAKVKITEAWPVTLSGELCPETL